MSIASIALLLTVTLISLAGNPAYADFADNSPCTLHDDIRFLPTDAGGAVVASQVCNANNVWETTATYSAADDKKVIWEPRFGELNFTSGGPNPFATDYVYSKAEALFPAPGEFQIAYARHALDPKNRSNDNRNQTSVNDQCLFYPKPWTTDFIKTGDALWLPPVATPDGKAGSLSYTITGMTGDSVDANSLRNGDTVRSAISQYNEAAAATNKPILVPWKIGDPDPTINFTQDPSLKPDDGTATAIARYKTTDSLYGVRRWVTGEVAITTDSFHVSPRAVAHEILHVTLALGHMSIDDGSLFTMSPTLDPLTSHYLTDGSGSVRAIDACTEKGMDLAPSPVVGP